MNYPGFAGGSELWEDGGAGPRPIWIAYIPTLSEVGFPAQSWKPWVP